MLGLFVAGLTALAVPAGPTDAPPALVGFNIPASAAEHGLRLFVRQAGVEVVFEVEQVKGRQTNAVGGRFTPRGALEALVTGTGLVVLQDEQTGAMAVKIDRRVGASEKTLPQDTTNETDMKRRKTLRTVLTALFLTAGASHLPAQTGSAQPAPAKPDEIVILSAFEVSAAQVGRYQSTEATSGSRVRVSTFDYPQSISIITREVFDDIRATRLLDAAKYVSGVTESGLPGGLDRISIRGFQTDGQVTDGFQRSDSASNFETVLVERIEVVKGPNALLAPRGTPGGTINVVTRKPVFGRNFGAISAEVGRFWGNRATLDVNRIFGAGQNFAFRVVGSEQDTEGYYHNGFHKTSVMPMVAWRGKTGAQVILQGSYSHTAGNTFGLPIDSSSGTYTKARLITGVDPRLNIFTNAEGTESRYDFRGFVTVPLSERFSMRLAGRYTALETGGTGVGNPSQAAAFRGGGVDPNTGAFVPGVRFPAPARLPVPAARSNIFNRGGNAQLDSIELFDVQNDYVHEFKSDLISTTTLAGVNVSQNKDSRIDHVISQADIDFDVPSTFVTPLIKGQLRGLTTFQHTREQVYIGESAELLKGRLLLSGNYSFNNYDLSTRDKFSNTNTVAQADTTLFGYGIVIKPIPNVALYYSEAQNAQPQGSGTIAAGQKPFRDGDQSEYGIRFQGWRNRLFLSLAHFKVKESDFGVSNPDNLVVPVPVPALPPLRTNRVAKGWEFEFRVSVTDQFSVIGNYANFTSRNIFNQEFGGVAERSWAVLGQYEFKQGWSKGLGVSLGADWTARRPGDQPQDLTPFSTKQKVIPNLPSFYLDARTIVNLTLDYKVSKHWRAQVNIDNLLDKEYLLAGANRYVVWPGDPRNVRLTVTYSF